MKLGDCPASVTSKIASPTSRSPTNLAAYRAETIAAGGIGGVFESRGLIAAKSRWNSSVAIGRYFSPPRGQSFIRSSGARTRRNRTSVAGRSSPAAARPKRRPASKIARRKRLPTRSHAERGNQNLDFSPRSHALRGNAPVCDAPRRSARRRWAEEVGSHAERGNQNESPAIVSSRPFMARYPQAAAAKSPRWRRLRGVCRQRPP